MTVSEKIVSDFIKNKVEFISTVPLQAVGYCY